MPFSCPDFGAPKIGPKPLKSPGGAIFTHFRSVEVAQRLTGAKAGLLRPVITVGALANLSMVGNVLIFCVGINLIWDKKVRVANLLPSIVAAVIAAFLPI